jgi:AcrR family transcriptional regulator
MLPKRLKLTREDRRKAIVDAAARLFAERGFRGVTTKELAGSVGVTEPVLYEHFKRKSDLYSAIIDERSRENFEKARELLQESARSDSPREFFIKLATLIVEKQSKSPEYMRLILFSALEKHELASLCFERHAVVIHKIVKNFIQTQIRQGRFRRTNAALAAQAFMAMVMHYSLFELHFGFAIVRASKKRAVESMVGIFLHGMSHQ